MSSRSRAGRPSLGGLALQRSGRLPRRNPVGGWISAPCGLLGRLLYLQPGPAGPFSWPRRGAPRRPGRWWRSRPAAPTPATNPTPSPAGSPPPGGPSPGWRQPRPWSCPTSHSQSSSSLAGHGLAPDRFPARGPAAGATTGPSGPGARCGAVVAAPSARVTRCRTRRGGESRAASHRPRRAPSAPGPRSGSSPSGTRPRATWSHRSGRRRRPGA
jgi:hypothetical protein